VGAECMVETCLGGGLVSAGNEIVSYPYIVIPHV
jgi:hypothetical protein